MKTNMNKSLYCLALFSLLSVVFFPESSLVAPNPNASKDQIRELGVELYSGQRQITFDGPKSGEGYFSADGTKMILQSERHGNNPFYQMYIMDLKSGQITRVSPGNGKTTCGWIHPNMKKAMWSSTHLDPEWEKKQKEEIESRKNPVKGRYSWSYDEQYDIFESSLDGKNAKRLTKELGYDAEGSYSPDGQWIAFASNRTGYSSPLNEEEKKLFQKDPSSQMEIYIMKSDGTQVRRLTNSLGYDGGPFFSADGRKITWRRFDKTGATAEIYTMNVDGSDQKQITHLNSMSWAPYFHPSGKYIVFASSVLGYSNFELFLVDAEGKQKPIRVTNDDGFDGLAAFSPDGKKMTWTHRNEKGESQIYLADWNHELALSALQLSETEPDARFKLATHTFSKDIEINDLKSTLAYLASKKMAGRLPGSGEETELTHDIAATFKKWRLVSPTGIRRLSGFTHSFDIVTGITLKSKNDLVVNQKNIELNREYRPISLSKSGVFEARPFTFVGYGLKTPATETLPAINNYADLDVKDKWVVFFKDYPTQVSKELRNHLVPFSSLAHKMTLAKNLGAYGVLVVDGPNLINRDKITKMRFDGAPTQLPAVEISLNVFLQLMNLTDEQYAQLRISMEKNELTEKIENKNTKISATIDFELQKKEAKQIIGFIPGPQNSSSIIVGAHMDHLGRGDVGNSLATSDDFNPIHFGADDNASGVASVLELAHYYSQPQNQKKLKHGIYFGLWSAEEMGVLGSKAFVDDWESSSKKKIKDSFIASINLDMVGRLKEKLIIQGVGSAKEWNRMAELVSLRSQVPVSLQNDPYLPTDAISFYLAEIPSISFFTGAHIDYHTPRDTAEKINYPGLLKITQVVQQFIQEISTNPTIALSYEKVEGGVRAQGTERSFRIYIGTIPDYSQEGVQGVRISGVSKNSPAEKGGLLAKDIIIEFNGKAIDSIHDYVFSLQAAEPNREVPLKIRRSNEVITLKVTPTLK
ncbi:MAG: M28 family peptidase [Bdellovibrionaceae bacterium]|nr:M28 family peptidase [Pseudobdellovibrionaceae bacterium]